MVEKFDKWQPRTPAFELERTMRRLRVWAARPRSSASATEVRKRVGRLTVSLLQLPEEGSVTCTTDTDVDTDVDAAGSEAGPKCVLGWSCLDVLNPEDWVCGLMTLVGL